MTEFPVEEVVSMLLEARRYQVRADLGGRVLVEGVVDLQEHRGVLRLGSLDREVAEVRWRDATALGQRLGGGRWVRIQGAPPAYVMPPDGDLLRHAAQLEVFEEGSEWVLRVADAPAPIRDDAQAFADRLLGPPRNEEERRRNGQMAQRLREERVDLEVRVARTEPLAVQVLARSGGDAAPTIHLTCRPTADPIAELPDARAVSDESVPFAALLLTLPTIGGWAQRDCHARWAQRSLDLLKAAGDDRYADLYAPGWSTATYDDSALGADPTEVHHPIVVGAFNEDQTVMPAFYGTGADNWFKSDPAYATNPDFYWKQAGYCRDYNHFGGEGLGLEDRWFFALRPGCPSYTDNLVNGRFYSARDWGYGGARIDESLNRLTFVRAIEQYNTYTFDGKRRAYLMLGHVVHLLQDQGQPDHARLVAHPGSSMDEEEAYGAYHYCEFLAVEAAAVAAAACWGPWSPACAAVAFGAAEAACWASASSDVVGFERLIGAPVGGTKHWQLSDVDTAIDAQGVVSDPPSTYDGFFKAIAALSVAEATNRGLDSALGCETLVLAPPIPGADPAIDTETADPAPYLALTEAVVPTIVGLSAGLMRHFYDIVNHPPILQRLAVVQWQPGAEPREFGVLNRFAPDHCTRYDARWDMVGGHRVLTNLHPSQALSGDANRPAYVFLLFGPDKAGDVPEVARRMKSVKCLAKGVNPCTYEDFSISLHLKEESDPALGYYYWGSFEPPPNCSQEESWITFEVSGEDAAAHLPGRPGAALDSDPAALATVDPTDPQYGWRDYAPGPDRTHMIRWDAARFRVEFEPQQLTLNASGPRNRSGVFSLRVEQEAMDCAEEPYWGVTRCPVTWSLHPTITALATGTSHPPEDVGLSIGLQEGHAKAVVTVKVTDQFVKLQREDRFAIFVDHVAGEGGCQFGGTAELVLSIG